MASVEDWIDFHELDVYRSIDLTEPTPNVCLEYTIVVHQGVLQLNTATCRLEDILFYPKSMLRS